MELSKQEKVNEWLKCSRDPLHYMFTHVKTWDGEARALRPFASGYPKAYQTKLGNLALDIIDVIKKGRDAFKHPDFHIFKSRQTYCTHLITAGVGTYTLLFLENCAGLVTSDKAEKLDNSNHSDFNTALGKVSYSIDHLPTYLKPDDSDLIRVDKHITVISNNSSIKGDCGITPGMGLQLSWVFNDEHAGQEFSFTKQSTIIEACKGAQICGSTGKGKNNVFYDIWEYGQQHPDGTSFQFREFDWKEKIEQSKHAKFYNDAVKRYKGDTAMLNQELNRSWSGISVKGRVFTSFIQSQHIVDIKPGDIKLGITCTGWDFGVSAPTVFIIATVIQKDIIILDSFFVSGASPKQVADVYKAKCKEWGVPYNRVTSVGDPSGISRPRESADYDSSFELFRKEDIYIQKGNNRILEGIQVINGAFYEGKLKINKRCTHLIDALNEAVSPTDSQGDVSKEGYVCPHPLIDHLDAFKYVVRYMVTMMHPSPQVKSAPFIGVGLGSSAPTGTEILFDK